MFGERKREEVVVVFQEPGWQKFCVFNKVASKVIPGANI